MSIVGGITHGIPGVIGIGANIGTPDVIMQYIPIWTAKIIDLGRSQDDLHLQATGGVFLGFLDGRRTSIRIDFTLSGPFQLFIIHLLEMLFDYCKGEPAYRDVHLKQTAIEENVEHRTYPEGTDIYNDSFYNGYKGYLYNANIFNMKDGSADIDKYLTIRQRQEITQPYLKRNVISISTQSDVLYNMYFHTFLYRRRKTYGDNIIEGNIFCSRYDPSDQVEIEVRYRELSGIDVYSLTNSIDLDEYSKKLKLSDASKQDLQASIDINPHSTELLAYHNKQHDFIKNIPNNNKVGTTHTRTDINAIRGGSYHVNVEYSRIIKHQNEIVVNFGYRFAQLLMTLRDPINLLKHQQLIRNDIYGNVLAFVASTRLSLKERKMVDII